MASASGGAAAPPPPPGEDELVAVPAALLKAMQEALRQQQERERQERQQHQQALEQVEAEMMGLRAADYPHVAALTASLLRHSAHDGKPRPKNPISLIYEAADALRVKISLTCSQLSDRQFVASVSAAPDPPVAAGRKYRTSTGSSGGAGGGPAPGTQEAADAFGRATGAGCSKRDARNAAAAVLLEGLLRGAPGVVARAWGPVISAFPLRPQDWGEVEPPSSSAAATAGATAAAAAAAAASQAVAAAGPGPGSEGRWDPEADRSRRQHLKERRVEEREYERGRKEEERGEKRRREEAEWRDRASGPPHEQLQRQARGAPPQAAAAAAGEPAPPAAAVQLSELPALQKHLEVLARRQPDQPPATALALLNQYAPAALLEVEYQELEKPSGRRGAPPLFEVTAVARTRLHRTEVARAAATAKSKRDAKQLAAARALDALLAAYDGVQRVAYAEETGERRRGAAKRGAPPRPRSVADARIDYSRPLEKRFKYGGAVADLSGVELLPPQRQRWGLGFGPAEAWAAQQELIAPLPEQAAFLGFTKGSQQQQQQQPAPAPQQHHHRPQYDQHHQQHQPWPQQHHHHQQQQQPNGARYHPAPAFSAAGAVGPPHWDGGYGCNGHPGGYGSNSGGTGGGQWGR